MSDAIETVISNAVADAGDIAPAADTTTSSSTDTATSDSGSDTGYGEAPAGGDTAAAAALDDPFAKEYGLTTKRADGKDNRIPYPRVKAIADNQVKKVVGQIAKELGITKAEAELKLEDVMGELGSRKTKTSEYESRLQNVDAIERLMETDPDRFLTILADANPAYKKFLQQQAAAVEQKQTTVNDDPMPEPDLDLGDGRSTYSMEGLKKLREWDKRSALREFDTKMNERLGPIEAERKKAAEAEKQRQHFEATMQRATEKVDQTLSRAQKWHGFNDHQAEILKVLQSDKTIDLYDAYMQVVIPKLAGDRTKMRQDLLTEIKGAPQSTSAAVNTPPAVVAGNKSIEDIIAESIRGLSK